MGQNTQNSKKEAFEKSDLQTKCLFSVGAENGNKLLQKTPTSRSLRRIEVFISFRNKNVVSSLPHTKQSVGPMLKTVLDNRAKYLLFMEN